MASLLKDLRGRTPPFQDMASLLKDLRGRTPPFQDSYSFDVDA
jgi:hypothetical protein